MPIQHGQLDPTAFICFFYLCVMWCGSNDNNWGKLLGIYEKEKGSRKDFSYQGACSNKELRANKIKMSY